MRTSGKKKSPRTGLGAGARFLPENVSRSGRRPAPAANERKQSEDAEKKRAAELRRGSGDSIGAREPRIHGSMASARRFALSNPNSGQPTASQDFHKAATRSDETVDRPCDSHIVVAFELASASPRP